MIFHYLNIHMVFTSHMTWSILYGCFKSWISYKSIMFGYNSSDWTYGWMAAFDGFTIFYSEPHEETIGMVHIILCFATHESSIMIRNLSIT